MEEKDWGRGGRERGSQHVMSAVSTGNFGVIFDENTFLIFLNMLSYLSFTPEFVSPFCCKNYCNCPSH